MSTGWGYELSGFGDRKLEELSVGYVRSWAAEIDSRRVFQESFTDHETLGSGHLQILLAILEYANVTIADDVGL